MDDFETAFADVEFLPGVDLYLWLRLVLVALTLTGLAVGIATALQ